MENQKFQNTNEDLKKQLEEKEHKIKLLKEQILVSSRVSESAQVKKKKTRRETWAAPKLRKSMCKCHFILILIPVTSKAIHQGTNNVLKRRSRIGVAQSAVGL